MNQSCTVCGDQQRQIFNYRNYDYYRCQSCLLVSTLPYPEVSVIEKHYSDKFKKGNYQNALAHESGRVSPFQHYLDILKKVLKRESFSGLNVLDIGCFTGELLVLFEKEGAKTEGIELQKEAAKIAGERLKGNVHQALIEEIDWSGKKFDIIVISGVIEHVINPNILMTKISELLTPTGLLLIQTPNSSSILARALGKYWPPYEPVEHIHLFGSKSMDLISEKYGMKRLKFVRHVKTLPVEYVYNMLETFGPEFHKLFKPIYRFLPSFLKKMKLPFYVGEMIAIYQKNNSKAFN